MQATLATNDLPSLHHVRRIGVVTDQLQDEVGLDRCAHIGASARIACPTALWKLLGSQVVCRLPHLLLASSAQEVQQQNVLALENGVAFELGAPVPVGLLQTQQLLPGPQDRIENLEPAGPQPRALPAGQRSWTPEFPAMTSDPWLLETPRHNDQRIPPTTDTAKAPLYRAASSESLSVVP